MNIIIVIIIIIIVIVLLLSFINTKQNIDGSLAGSNYNESIMSEYSNYNKYNQNYQKQNKNIQLNKYFNKVQFDQDYTDVLNAITLLTQNSKGFVIPDVTTKSCKNPQDIQKDVDIFVNKLNDAI